MILALTDNQAESLRQVLEHFVAPPDPSTDPVVGAARYAAALRLQNDVGLRDVLDELRGARRHSPDAGGLRRNSVRDNS